MAQATFITIASDGGCSPNPGLGGWAFAIYDGEAVKGSELLDASGRAVEMAGTAEHSTNNIMEVTALDRALCMICSLAEAGRMSPCEIRLRLDSQYTLNAFFDWIPGWKRRGWRKADGKPVKNQELMMELDHLKAQLEEMGFSFRNDWHRGHAGDFANEHVDQMVQAAREEYLGKSKCKVGKS